jgi:hypothetical protein
VESTIRLFRDSLFEAFWEWVETNKHVIDERMLNHLTKEGKKAEDDCNTALKIIASALWMLNMVSSWVWVGIGPNKVGEIQYLAEGIDEKTTKRLLHLIAACLSLQYLPKEIAEKEIPIISGSHFSLKEYIRQR